MADSGDGSRLLELQLEGNLKTHAVINTGGGTAMCCQYHATGQVLAVGLSDSTIKIYDSDTMMLLHTLVDPDAKTKLLAVTNLRFLPGLSTSDSKSHILLATYASGFIKLWHYTSRTPLFSTNEDRKTTLCGTFNPDGSKYLSSGSDSIIHVYDTHTGKQLRSYKRSDGSDVMNGHVWNVYAIKYHDVYARTFLTGGWDKTVQFWDEREKHAVRKLFGPYICGDGLDIDQHSDHILTASFRKDNPLEVWDFKQGTKLSDFPVDQNLTTSLYCAQWLGKDYVICGGCDSNVAKVVDRGTRNTVGQVTNLNSGVYSLDHGIKYEGFNNVRPSTKVAICAGDSLYIFLLSKT